ncbi:MULTISPECIES: MOP flippase family protein [unclassified Bradyrhizobium]|uniref:MOP flippase family protein n=1 Tax=unclassified Bradyrhizobium TaxID=2631580 RepID=UPI0033958D76
MKRTPGSALTNVQWTSMSQIARVGLQLTSVMVMARILPASDFGLLAMATIVTNFAGIFRDLGTSAAIIQRQELSRALLDTVFWSNILFGFLVGGIIAATSPLVATAFHDPAVQPLLVISSLAFPIGASGAPHLALLERSSRFKIVSIIEVFSSICGAVVAIGAAISGVGAISLVIQALIGTILSTALFWLVSRWRPRAQWSKAEIVEVLGFSGNLVAFNVINYFSRNADGMLIGRYLGPVQLGYYTIAYRIMLFPLQNLTFVLTRAFLPIFSGQQQNTALIGRQYLRLLQFIFVITAPLMLGLWSVREPFVVVVLGEKWQPASDIVAWLAPTGLLQSIVSTTGTVLIATGKTRLMRNLGLVCSLIYLTGFVLGLSQGGVGVARAYFFANILTSVIYLHYTVIQVNLDLSDVVVSLCRPLLAALVMVVLIISIEHLILPGSWHHIAKLALLVLVGTAIYAATMIVAARDIVVDMRAAVLKKA